MIVRSKDLTKQEARRMLNKCGLITQRKSTRLTAISTHGRIPSDGLGKDQ